MACMCISPKRASMKPLQSRCLSPAPARISASADGIHRRIGNGRRLTLSHQESAVSMASLSRRPEAPMALLLDMPR